MAIPQFGCRGDAASGVPPWWMTIDASGAGRPIPNPVDASYFCVIEEPAHRIGGAVVGDAYEVLLVGAPWGGRNTEEKTL
jgi:hypothetical protein